MSFSIKDCPWEIINKACRGLDVKPTKHVLCVSTGEQKLYHITDGSPTALYPVSTSRRQPSCIEDSLGTPLGLHEIAEKIGHGVPEGGVFMSRQYTGKHFTELSEEEQITNLVITRILWLKGLEEGINSGPGCDSYNRYIYIHGTNHPDRIGVPQTDGCIALRDNDLIDLFNCCEAGTLVLIAH